MLDENEVKKYQNRFFGKLPASFLFFIDVIYLELLQLTGTTTTRRQMFLILVKLEMSNLLIRTVTFRN